MLLIQMRSGTFQKRKPFIGAGTAELVWTASLCFSYHQKTWGDSVHNGTHLIWMGWLRTLSYSNDPVIFIYPRVFHHYASVINWTIFIFAICTYGPRCKIDKSDWSWRSHLARCREVVNNSAKGFHPTTSREYFHEIFSRFRIINSMPVLSPSDIMLWSYTDLLSV